MDWKKTFNIGQWFIHGVFVISISLGVGATLFALRIYHLQSTQEEREHKINSVISQLKNVNYFEQVGQQLYRAESDKANDLMRSFSGKIAQLEESLDYKISESVSSSLKLFQKHIGSISSISAPLDALRVLRKKLTSLNEFAQNRNYANVYQISGRMLSRTDRLNIKNIARSKRVTLLGADLERLKKIVATSSLSAGEKSELNFRFDSMLNEIDQLIALNKLSTEMARNITESSLSLSQWIIDAEKKASDVQKIRLEKQNLLVIFLAGIVTILTLCWVGIAYLFRWQKIKIAQQVEHEVKGVIQKGFMEDQRFLMDHYSEKTRNEIISLLDELKVKLNLGTMLHVGLPFSGCMIDPGLKISWYNQLFLEQFYLTDDEVRSETFNWDHLRDYFNLGEDPVYQALTNKISGIYPIKIKQDEYTPSQPYEMYVTPIKVNREDRVMIFFYPLVSVKEAINDQVNLSKNAIIHFIESWKDNNLNSDRIKLIQKDFINNDLGVLFHDLKSIFERVEEEKLECFRAINELEKNNKHLEQILTELNQVEVLKKEVILQEVKVTNELKDSFLFTLERLDNLIQLNRSTLGQNDELKSEVNKMQVFVNEVKKKTKETQELMAQLEFIKIDYKKIKTELLEVKSKLISVNSTLFAQLPTFDDNQQKLANRYKDELARLDFNAVTLDKKLSQLDILLSKLQIMYEIKSSPQIEFNLKVPQKDFEVNEVLNSLEKIHSEEEIKVVDGFKHLYSLMKKNLTLSPRAEEHSTKDSQAPLS